MTSTWAPFPTLLPFKLLDVLFNLLLIFGLLKINLFSDLSHLVHQSVRHISPDGFFVGRLVRAFVLVKELLQLLILLLLRRIHHSKVAFFVGNSCGICFQPHFCFIHSHGGVCQKPFSFSLSLTVSLMILISVFDEAHRDGCLWGRHLDRQFLGEHVHHIWRRRLV